ncbi:polysaccharide export protein [Rutstroemia sp. NJR-2017a WRK4]|nr:polysaccharide export protein [Rutstroemia sp. NJR-2017a WRK4]
MLLSLNPPLKRIPISTTSSENGARKERIFIASMHWNNEKIIRSHWGAAVLDLVRHFGVENVYISIVESGSWDDTKGALRELDEELGKLGVERSIELSNTTHTDQVTRVPKENEEGWIWTSRGKKEMRRIPYLAKVRNRVMEKLKYLEERTDGQEKRSFDKVLWLNDVIFTTEDVVTLLSTREGNYAAACAVDFAKPPAFYDTFALRDISGEKPVTETWPFFLAAISRNTMKSSSPVPVKSCWNGIVVFQAEPFYKNPSLKFRGIPDSLARHHLEGSECCLIHADNSLSRTKGVWLNPNVRVSYNSEADEVVNPKEGRWPSRRGVIQGIWSNRWARWTQFPKRYAEHVVVERRARLWRSEMQQTGQVEVHEEGMYCLINEMQVLAENGWAHV